MILSRMHTRTSSTRCRAPSFRMALRRYVCTVFAEICINNPAFAWLPCCMYTFSTSVSRGESLLLTVAVLPFAVFLAALGVQETQYAEREKGKKYTYSVHLGLLLEGSR